MSDDLISYPTDPSVLAAAQCFEAKIPYEMFGHSVPTYISECPHCGEPQKWSTTGILVPLTCKKCKKLFKMF